VQAEFSSQRIRALTNWVDSPGSKHALPRTYEWNAAIEHSIGRADVVTLTYLGAAGRELMSYGDSERVSRFAWVSTL
jgi:hypothetical protein